MRAMLALVLGLAALASNAGAAAPASHDAARGRGAIIERGLPHAAPTALDSVPHPWPGVALLLSAVGTALPVAIASSASTRDHDPRIGLAALGAEVITPAAGFLYGGLARRGAIGMGVRALGFGIVALAAAPDGYWRGETSSDFGPGILVMVLGAAVVGTSAVWDVVVVPDHVDRRNADWLRAHATVGLGVTRDARAPALAVAIRF